MYLTPSESTHLSRLLRTFFALPYSTDLDGKDAEFLLRKVKLINGRLSRRKELFDLIDGSTGYSVKTLRKRPAAERVDIQEQRFCDVEEIRKMMVGGSSDGIRQGELLLSYMRDRVVQEMKKSGIATAKSAILLKWWNLHRTEFSFRYWEEDFLGYIDKLWQRNEAGEIEWVLQPKGLHARDRCRADSAGKAVRLLRMHYKHNQIFTDHDIPEDAVRIDFTVRQFGIEELADLLHL